MVLLTLELSRSSLNSQKVDHLLDVGIGMANFSLDTAQYDLFLIYARLFTSIRRNHSASDNDNEDDNGNGNLSYYYFYNVDNIDGLCDILGRNMKFIPDDRKDLVLNISLWVYPEPELPYFPIDLVSQCHRKCTTNKDALLKWTQTCVDVLENYYNWEVYSFVLSHLCPQLADNNTQNTHRQTILRLVKVICQQMQLRFPTSLTFQSVSPDQPTKADVHSEETIKVDPHSGVVPSEVTKADIQSALVRTLSSVITYKKLLSKKDEDDIMSSVIFALNSWYKTGVPCLHFLNVACYEFPESIKKFLNPLLSNLQTRMSSPLTISPILHFLMNLSEVPTLLSNLTLDEFKRIFAIAFKVRDR
ncbi:unnamed protein product [Ambrosiozyma monospora]|uniref:Unnamed protein product n=1 Tax=Ambrosiozyma monospora TaxID=43982 RepID=A0ACB5TXV1_AMBMO|nr:unnamed protein product [Ambrosiozyma monospora]